jgi:hypothetical protein
LLDIIGALGERKQPLGFIHYIIELCKTL